MSEKYKGYIPPKVNPEASEKYKGLIQNLKNTFIELKSSEEKVEYVVWANNLDNLSEAEERAVEDFTIWAFQYYETNELNILNEKLKAIKG